MSYVITVRRFAAGERSSEMISATEPFADRNAARHHADELWMQELTRAQAEVAKAREAGTCGMSAIPTGLNADMKAVTLHTEADGVLRSTIICVERAR